MSRAKRIYVLMIRVNKLFSSFSSRYFLIERAVETQYSTQHSTQGTCLLFIKRFCWRTRQSLKGILTKKQFCFKSQAGVCVKLFQWFEVDNFLSVLNAGCFFSAILGVQVSRGPPCLFLQSLMGHFVVNTQLDTFKIQHCVNLEI